MERTTKRGLIFVLLVTPGLLGLSAFWFLPRPEIPLNEALPEGDLVAFSFGVFQDGSDRHPASGNVTLYLDNETHEWFLFFRDYDASPGRDPRFFLCDAVDPLTRAEIDGCIRLSVPGRGPADVRGDFRVPVPPDVDPRDSGSVVTWDLRFNQRHAVAPLAPAMPVDYTITK